MRDEVLDACLVPGDVGQDNKVLEIQGKQAARNTAARAGLDSPDTPGKADTGRSD